MPARSTARSPSPASSTSKPRFVERLKKPFGGKARLFSDFFIQPDDPHRVYGPGDVITGSVVLKVTKPFSVTHIVVCLHGYSQVYKTPNSPGEGYRHYNTILASGKSRKSGGYYGNGLVSLFEDEVTLCGDGRLGEGAYQFNFELIFPKQHLPSSIDVRDVWLLRNHTEYANTLQFERGTVTYMITATMTRPTAISPTSTCDRRINFQEDIDVAPLSQPKPRVITLEPIARRSQKRNRVKRQPTTGTAGTTGTTGTDQSTTASTADSEDTATEAGANDRAIETGSQVGVDPPQSPVPSDISFDSYMSSGGTSSAIDSAAPSARTCGSRHTSGKSSHTCPNCQKQPITSTISIEKAGFLRGDTIPVKVWLTHTRAVKSLRGVIVTLYRQARVDLHPALPMIRGGNDDIYPKSKTGLAGLSLSSAGSTHTYRKDLDQQFASLIVNPASMQAEVKVNLRVPDEAFPSIASVPGAMISFKYYVEVIVDIQGKLAGLDKYLPNAGTPQGGFISGRVSENNGGTYAPFSGHFISTEEIRRERSVIYSVFEVVVGTRDSERRSLWKQPATDASTIMGPEELPSNGDQTEPLANYSGANGQRMDGHFDAHRLLSWDQYWRHHPPGHNEDPPPIIDFPPPPQIENEEHLSEKERIQRAEARLLPSAPPDIGPSTPGAVAHAPSAPQLHDDRPLPPLPSAPPHFDFELSGPSAPRMHTVDHIGEAEVSAPAYEHHEQTSMPATDDKEELRRQRLEMERSAPQTLDDEDEAEAGASSSAWMSSAPSAPTALSLEPSAPSAPFLTEEDHLGFSVPSSHHALPRYER
jgi:hypothetical protein